VALEIASWNISVKESLHNDDIAYHALSPVAMPVAVQAAYQKCWKPEEDLAIKYSAELEHKGDFDILGKRKGMDAINARRDFLDNHPLAKGFPLGKARYPFKDYVES